MVGSLGSQRGEAFSHGVGDLVAAVPFSRLHHLARECTTNDLLHAFRYLNEAIYSAGHMT